MIKYSKFTDNICSGNFMDTFCQNTDIIYSNATIRNDFNTYVPCFIGAVLLFLHSAPMKSMLPSSLVHWSYLKKLSRECTKSVEVYDDKAQKIKFAYHCTYRQISVIRLTTRVVSLNTCDLFLPVLVYMQEEQNCSH